MPVMVRDGRSAALLAALLTVVSLAIVPQAHGQDVKQYLRDQYQGKTLVLRGFPVADVLRYDSSGVPDSARSGDWTTSGFVLINDVHLSEDRLVIKAQRMVAARIDGEFELRPFERSKGTLARKKPAYVEIKADPGMHNPSVEQVAALASKIFLTAPDSLADLVPDYWKPCVRGGLKGTDKNCAFASEILAIPGVAPGGESSEPAAKIGETGSSNGEASHSEGGPFRAGKGWSPPRPTFQRDPEFSEPARVAKFQGTVLLKLVVNKQGAPTNIHISRPLGYGLDAKAVEAIQSWTFSPAEKDGVPVNVEIAVEMEFRLY